MQDTTLYSPETPSKPNKTTKKNNNIFRRIIIKEKGKELVKEKLKGLEETVELNINANDPEIHLFAEGSYGGLSRGEVFTDLLLYPEKGKEIIALSISGLNYIALIPPLDKEMPLSFIYKYKGVNQLVKLYLKNPFD